MSPLPAVPPRFPDALRRRVPSCRRSRLARGWGRTRRGSGAQRGIGAAATCSAPPPVAAARQRAGSSRSILLPRCRAELAEKADELGARAWQAFELAADLLGETFSSCAFQCSGALCFGAGCHLLTEGRQLRFLSLKGGPLLSRPDPAGPQPLKGSAVLPQADPSQLPLNDRAQAASGREVKA